MLRSQLLQHVRRGRISGLRFFAALHPHFVKEDHAELLGRIDVEGLSCLLVNLRLQLSDPYTQLVPVGLQRFRIHTDAGPLHAVQRKDQRHLHFPIKLLHSGLPEAFKKHRHGVVQNIAEIAAVGQENAGLLLRSLCAALFPKKFRAGRNRKIQILLCQLLHGIAVLQRIQKIGRDLRVQKGLFLLPAKEHFLSFQSRLQTGKLFLQPEAVRFFRSLKSTEQTAKKPFLRHKALNRNQTGLLF